MYLPGTYQNGFAPRDGEPLYPELWRGCVGAWSPSLGPSGLIVRDWSGYQRHATVTNAAATAVQILNGVTCFNIASTNHYLNPSITWNYSGPVTLAFWNYIYSASPSARFFGGSSSDRFQTHCPYSDDRVYWDYGPVTSAGRIAYVGYAANGYADKWTHVYLTSGGIANTSQKIYLDGKLVAEKASSSGPSSSFSWYVGRPSFSHTGAVTDVRVYTRNGSASEAATLARHPGIAYQLAPVRLAGESAAAFNRRRRLLLAGVV